MPHQDATQLQDTPMSFDPTTLGDLHPLLIQYRKAIDMLEEVNKKLIKEKRKRRFWQGKVKSIMRCQMFRKFQEEQLQQDIIKDTYDMLKCEVDQEMMNLKIQMQKQNQKEKSKEIKFQKASKQIKKKKRLQVVQAQQQTLGNHNITMSSFQRKKKLQQSKNQRRQAIDQLVKESIKQAKDSIKHLELPIELLQQSQQPNIHQDFKLIEFVDDTSNQSQGNAIAHKRGRKRKILLSIDKHTTIHK